MKKTLTVRVGADPKWGHDKDEELVVFEPGHTGANFVNVDTITRPGILRAEQMGLVPSGLADLIVTSTPTFAIQHLFDRFHKGRALVLFRHPVDRLVSKFYYSQIATWEKSFHPEWADMTLLEWAENVNNENNPLVKSLSGVSIEGTVRESDFRTAARNLRDRFVVGLMNQMEESVHRFNIILGVDESEEANRLCMDEFFGHGVRKQNSNAHPQIKRDDPAYQVLAARNEFDIRLYEVAIDLFEEQKEVILSHLRESKNTGTE